jgi:hypothetical protein
MASQWIELLHNPGQALYASHPAACMRKPGRLIWIIGKEIVDSRRLQKLFERND